MRIGIDIDDTITNSKEFVCDLKKKRFPDLRSNELLPKKIYEQFKIEIDDEIHQNVTLKKNVKESLRRLNKMGHELIFITARGNISPHSVEDTIAYFHKNEIPYDEIVFYATHKGVIAKEKKIDLYIDDRENLLTEVNQMGIPVIKMRRDNEKSAFVQFTNWKDITDYIERECANGTNNNK